MLKKNIKVGSIYYAKVNNKLTTVRVDRIENVTRNNKNVTRYYVTNLKTGRQVVFRSAAKFRLETYIE